MEDAVDIVYPHAKRQRCWAHKLRNVSDKPRKRDQEQCVKEARAIYSTENKSQAVKEFRSWAKTWRPISPDAVNCLEKDLEELLCLPQGDAEKASYDKCNRTGIPGSQKTGPTNDMFQ